MKSKRNNRLKDYNKCAKLKCEKIISDKDLDKMYKLSRYNKESKKYWSLRSKKDKCIAKKCNHLIKGQLKGKHIKLTNNNKNNFRKMLSKALKKRKN